MSSIYVAIPSIRDSEFIKTLLRCINHSSKNNHISIGAAVCLFDNELDSVPQNIPYENIKVKILDRSVHKGVGVARRESMSFYNNEDYVLMIDSHTDFMDNWDEILINKINLINDKKPLLTSYPPEYKYVYKNVIKSKSEWKNIYISNFVNGSIRDKSDHDSDCEACNEFSAIPLWEEKRVEPLDNDFVINPKISGGFLFADKRFANEYPHLVPYDYSFFEEELIMSIELFNLGWTFYSPTDYIPIAHLYAEDINKFGGDRSSLEEYEVIELNTKQNYLNYILDTRNRNKIEKFEKHLGINILDLAEAEKRKVEK